MLEEIERTQVGRDDGANVLLAFARQQLDIIDEREEEEAKANSNP